MSVHLSITPISLDDIPSVESILYAAKALVEESHSWPKEKRFIKGTVQTFSRPRGPDDGAAWHGRVSYHAPLDGSWEEFYQGLAIDKPMKEQQYIPELEKVSLVKKISDNQEIWTAFYKFIPPLSPRTFTVLVTTFVEECPLRTGWIVSIPVDVELSSKEEQQAVKGRYVAVETIGHKENDTVEWRMLTSSTPAGSIPQWITERAVPGKVSKDVPHFLNWLRKQRKATRASVTR